MEKKGVSGVITTVLLILLTIAAVIVVWGVIKTLLESNSESISLGIDTLDIDIESVYIEGTMLNIKIKRQPTQGNLSAIKIIAEEKNGKSSSFSVEGSLREHETKNFEIPITTFQGIDTKSIKKISAYPISKTQGGKEITGKFGGEYIIGKDFVSTKNLIAYYPLNGNANDVSGNNLHGRIFGDTSAVGGKIGQAYKFDGNDDAIVVNHSTQFNSISNAITVSAWVNKTSRNNLQNHQQRIVTKADNLVLYFLPNSNKPGFYLGSLSVDSKDKGITARSEVNLNEWNHIVGVYNSGLQEDNFKIYVNGQLSNSTTVPSGKTFSLGVYNLGIGAYNVSGLDYEFNGTIDDVRIYDRALTPAEITELYNRQCSLSSDCNDNNSSTTDTCNTTNGLCVYTQCTPQCSGLECGDNGCGGSCGTCSSGNVCSEGECVRECIDSDGETSFSINPFLRGNISYYDRNSNTLRTIFDSCSYENLNETYCDERGNGFTYEILCEEGCNNGRCVLPTDAEVPSSICEDSDNGRTFETAGKVTLTFEDFIEESIESEDRCVSSGRLLEYYCNQDGNRIISTERQCSNSERCENGACVPRNPTIIIDPPPPCTSGTSRCEDGTTNYFLCENGQWVNKGNIPGQCGYTGVVTPPEGITCESDTDCSEDEFCNSSGRCQKEEEGEEEEPLGGKWIIVIIIIVILIVITIGVIVFIMIRNQNKRQNKSTSSIITTSKPPLSPSTSPPNSPPTRS
ncbi:MAG: LamG domain-containing protein [Candidatus Pacearchaeota archaeon]